MLDRFFSSSNEIMSIERNYLSSFIIEAARKFSQEKYQRSYVRCCLRNMVLFGKWLKRNHIPIQDVTRSHTKRFFSSYPSLKSESRGKAASGINLVITLIQEKFPPKRHVFQDEIDRFVKHLRLSHGLRQKVLCAEKPIKAFLEFSFPSGQILFHKLTASTIRNFIESIPPTRSNHAKRTACSALRKYFRFLKIYGIKTEHLEIAIPRIPSFRRHLPRHMIDPISLRSLLRSINRSTDAGKRNYAIILCLNDLAMRIGDVANITLDDIDWRKGTICIHCAKTGSPFLMPVPKRVGEALIDYIKNSRPQSQHRHVFMTHKNHPPNLPVSAKILQLAVSRLWLRAGLSDKFSGTHIFRFSTATALRKNGNSLKTIADFLGHQSIEVTKIYAQVDLDALRQIAQPWPDNGGAK